ncbi:hypothetical protein CDN99_13240 [Roseateles aquatilis]|uniref:Uncharacterized protein n=2 Tax=Roseateles aquatilis TaxID=431061 RepID=A0A246JCV2_9BURK|nr:hypothetical protein CDN99_13240 [Roseateles aquatilis]
MSIKPAARKAATDTLSIKKIVKGADDTAVDAEMAEIAGLVDQRLKKVPTLSGVAAPVQTSGNWTDFTAELQHYVSQLEAATQGVPALQQVERDIAHLRLLSNMMADLSYGYRSVRQRGYRIGTEATSIAKLRDQNGDLLAISTYLADELDENSLQRDTSKSYLSNIASFSKGAGATLAGEIMESEKRTELFLHPLSEEVQKVYEGSAYGGHVL